MPASQFLLTLLLVANVLSSLLALRVGDVFTGALALLVIANAVVYLVYVWLVLRLAGKASRFLQCGAALLGVNLLMELAGLPLVALANAGGGAADPSALSTLAVLLAVGLYLWTIDVAGFVMSRALEQPYVVGLLIMLVYAIGVMSVSEAWG